MLADRLLLAIGFRQIPSKKMLQFICCSWYIKKVAAWAAIVLFLEN
jgi:hypothetical protein